MANVKRQIIVLYYGDRDAITRDLCSPKQKDANHLTKKEDLQRTQERKRIAIIGCGAIGAYVAKNIRAGVAGRYELAGVLDVPRPEAAKKLADESGCRACKDLKALLRQRPDIVIEAATREAVWTFGEECLKKGASLTILSSGALLDDEFRKRLTETAGKMKKKVYVPSGALGGLDIARAASVLGKAQAVLVTRKPPAALAGAPHLAGRDLQNLREAEKVFDGPVTEGVSGFPQNVNVAASLSLAMGSTDAVKLAIVADPSLISNVHRVEFSGEFGRAYVEMQGNAMPDNPKTSALAAMSILALLKRIQDPLEVG
jgi:aspartate dehydrogenase